MKNEKSENAFAKLPKTEIEKSIETQVELARLQRMERLMKSSDGARIMACLEAMEGILNPVQAIEELNAEAVRMQTHLSNLEDRLAGVVATLTRKAARELSEDESADPASLIDLWTKQF